MPNTIMTFMHPSSSGSLNFKWHNWMNELLAYALLCMRLDGKCFSFIFSSHFHWNPSTMKKHLNLPANIKIQIHSIMAYVIIIGFAIEYNVWFMRKKSLHLKPNTFQRWLTIDPLLNAILYEKKTHTHTRARNKKHSERISDIIVFRFYRLVLSWIDLNTFTCNGACFNRI